MNRPNDAPHGAAAVILAGGKSTRLGRDKASEVLLGRTLLQRAIDAFAGIVDQYVVVSAKGQQLPAIEAMAPVAVVEDEFPESGPLGGIFTGLRAADSPRALVVACDMPLLQPALLRALLDIGTGHKLVVPRNAGRVEPLCAVYATSCIEPLRSALETGSLRVTSFVEEYADRYVEEDEWRPFDAEGRSFHNLNRQSDLDVIEAILREKASDI